MRILIDLFLAAGLIFAVAGTSGILHMPDTFCRMQASTCVSTLGALGVILAGVLYAFCEMGSVATGIKIILIGVLIFCVNPVGSHVIAKGAYRHGIRPDKEMQIDDFRRDTDE